jgi:cysteine-rich repeat protein
VSEDHIVRARAWMLHPWTPMLRFVLLLCCVLSTGCFPIIEEDDIHDIGGDSPPPPPPRPAVCGDRLQWTGESCDDGNLVNGDGCSANCRVDARVRVSWRLTTLAGETQPCPDGFDVAEVIAQQHSMMLPIKRAFDCSAGTADLVLEELAPIGHDIKVLIKSASGQLYGESMIDHIDIKTETGSSHEIVTDAGKIHVWWKVWLGTQPTLCDGVSTVQVAVRDTSGTIFSQAFPCGGNFGNPFGVTPLLPTGSYSVDVSAVRGTQSASVTLDGIAVPTGGRAVISGTADLVF